MKTTKPTGSGPEIGTIEEPETADRLKEWFVPAFGPRKARALLGLLFLPYTGMVISYSVMGSTFAKEILWDRAAAIGIIYFLGLGIGAHALDALGSGGSKPWGNILTRQQLWILASGSLVAAYAIAAYYIALDVPLLLAVALIEGFFVFSYNFEWFEGKFHNDAWFAFSWGFLPVLAGNIIQTNRVSLPALLLAASMALFSAIEIRASKPYKELKRRRIESLSPDETLLMNRYEGILKCVSCGVILLCVAFILLKLA